MDIGMNGKRVVVTAGAQGIGLAITGAFVAAGAQVHICDINENFLAAAKAKFPAVSQSRTDVADEAQVDVMFAELGKRWGGLDVLVNNAGIAGPTAKVEDTDLTEWSQTIAVNLTGPFLCTRRAVPLLKAAGGGSIVNLSSIAGRLGFPLRTPYSASKYGVIGLTETWAMELGPSHIRVNAILPGLTDTKFASALTQNPAVLKSIMPMIALNRMAQPVEIAPIALYLASNASSYVTGASHAVDGGFLA